METARNPYLIHWKWIVFLAPLWWVTGFNIAIYHLAALFLLLEASHAFSRADESFFLPPSSRLIGFLMIIYILSLCLNSYTADSMRVLASLNNLSIWGMGLFLIIVLSNTFSLSHIREYLGAIAWIALPSAIATVIAFALIRSGVHTVSFDTPLYGLTRYLGHNTLIENTLSIKFIWRDWFASSAMPRLNLFSPYSVAGGEVIMLSLIMLSALMAIERKSKNYLFLAVFGLAFAGFLMTLSRMPLIAYASGFVVVFLIQKKKPIGWIFIFFVMLTLFFPLLDKVFSLLLSAREGSNIGRLELYRYSLSFLKGAEWILGLGVKPRDDVFVVPIGSHSTYLSVIFRMGAAGFICFLWLQIYLFTQWYFLKGLVIKRRNYFILWKALGWAFIAMAMCMLTDEIDVPQFLAFLYFSIIGIFEGFRRCLLAEWRASLEMKS